MILGLLLDSITDQLMTWDGTDASKSFNLLFKIAEQNPPGHVDFFNIFGTELIKISGNFFKLLSIYKYSKIVKVWSCYTRL